MDEKRRQDVVAEARITRIEDPLDPRLDGYRNLHDRADDPTETSLVAEGWLVVRRLLESGLPVESVLTTPAKLEEIRALLPPSVPVLVAPPAVIREAAGFRFSRGCLARAARPPVEPELLEALASRPCSTTVVAEGVTDPRNLGALFRNALALGTDAVVCDPRGADPFSRRSVRVSLGSVLRLRVTVEEPGAAIVRLRSLLGDGLQVVAATSHPDAEPLQRFHRSSRLALLVGSEGKGLSPELLETADRRVLIPMAPEGDSLNVAAATAVLLHALRIDPDPHQALPEGITIDPPREGLGSVCEPILRALPAWFGIEEALVRYVRDIQGLPTLLGRIDGEVAGFLTLRLHFDAAAEIHVMGVLPDRHRRGLGRALVERAEAYLRARGVELLQVKTLSPAHPDPGYALTRAFYQSLGFQPLEEHPELWGPANPCLQLVKRL